MVGSTRTSGEAIGLTERQVRRFWSQVVRSSGCWMWTQQFSHDGYGRFFVNYRRISAPRIAWEVTNGPIPAGMVIRHACDNPPCVNPDHLEVGTQADNIADKVSRSRQAMGRRVNTARLTESQVVEIRRRYAAGGASVAALAREYGVTGTPVHRIVTGRSWKHLLGNHTEQGISDLELL